MYICTAATIGIYCPDVQVRVIERTLSDIYTYCTPVTDATHFFHRHCIKFIVHLQSGKEYWSRYFEICEIDRHRWVPNYLNSRTSERSPVLYIRHASGGGAGKYTYNKQGYFVYFQVQCTISNVLYHFTAAVALHDSMRSGSRISISL